MSTIVSTALIAAPPAFLAGWILSKVVFRHISLTRPQAVAPPAVKPANTVTDEPGNAGQLSAGEPANTRKFNMLRQKLAGALAESQSLRAEIQLMKEAAAEREHTVIDLKRKLQVQLKVPEESMRSAPAKQKQFIQKLEGQLGTQQQHIAELKHELEAADTRAKRTTQRFGKWRQKFKPMARQFRQQRTIINELREELRQRDLEQQKIAAARAQAVNPPIPAQTDSALLQAANRPDMSKSLAADVPAAACTVTSPDYGDQEREDLQALRGIGPALQKKLNEKGIYRLQQLAYMNAQELSELGRALGISKKLLGRHDWIRQARQLLKMPELPAAEKVEV